MRDKVQPPLLLRAVSDHARRQHGVLSAMHLMELGLSRQAISRLVAKGWLVPIFRGVYAIGTKHVSPDGRCMAGVLAVGESFLSHNSAAGLWGLIEDRPYLVEVTVAGQGASNRNGLSVHRARSLTGRTTTKRGIPVTTPARTVIDCAARSDQRQTERLLAPRHKHPRPQRRGEGPQHPANALRRRHRHRQRLRGALPDDLRRRRDPTPDRQPPARQLPPGLPLAGAQAHRRDRRLRIAHDPPRAPARQRARRRPPARPLDHPPLHLARPRPTPRLGRGAREARARPERLAPLPLRRALVDEGLHALEEVLGAEARLAQLDHLLLDVGRQLAGVLAERAQDALVAGQ